MPELKSQLKEFVSGGVGGIGVVLIGHPFDTIKVNLQYQGTSAMSKRGFVGCVTSIYKYDGALGFYKGMSAPLLGVSPLIAMSFWGYGIGKRMFTNPSTSPTAQRPLRYHEYFVAGMVSGLFTTPVVVPGDQIKCLLQIQQGGNKVYKGLTDCLGQIVRKEGLRGLYRGTCATLLRDSPGSGLFYMVYEFMARNLSKLSSTGEKNVFSILTAGGVAGIVFWLFAIVPDVIKTRQQTAPIGQYTSVRRLLRNTISQEGVRALFTGLTPVLIRSFPSNAVCFLGFEYTLQLLNKAFP